MNVREFGKAGMFRGRAFWAPKGGAGVEEYEDAFSVSESSAPFRTAVADGATEAAFARRWARFLADAGRDVVLLESLRRPAGAGGGSRPRPREA
ncbi:MAG: hypothetical protein BRD29_00935 [Bacteroidetes bacterium QH_2_67_10]|nr:MAG: hypothetical protein BRD29_00935 [Bacteroidetes bacterium QH_2_67_10]